MRRKSDNAMAKHRKANATGRSKTSRFARLDHQLLNSRAYRSLTPNARALLVELEMLNNGTNNGQIILSVADAAARMGVSDHKAARAAFDELIAVGMIAMAKDAYFKTKVGERRAREWRLTWLAVPNKSGPTHDYLNWQSDGSTPSGKRSAKRADMGLRVLAKLRKGRAQNQNAGEDSPSMATNQCPNSVVAGEDSTPVKLENDANQPIPLEGDSSLHTAVTIGRGQRVRDRHRPFNATIRACIGVDCRLATYAVEKTKGPISVFPRYPAVSNRTLAVTNEMLPVAAFEVTV
jgi:hypothetical protein